MLGGNLFGCELGAAELLGVEVDEFVVQPDLGVDGCRLRSTDPVVGAEFTGIATAIGVHHTGVLDHQQDRAVRDAGAGVLSRCTFRCSGLLFVGGFSIRI